MWYPSFNGDDDDILRSVESGKYDTTLLGYTNLSNNAKDLIARLLTCNPNERITAEQALSHPWFKTSEFASISRVNNIIQY